MDVRTLVCISTFIKTFYTELSDGGPCEERNMQPKNQNTNMELC